MNPERFYIDVEGHRLSYLKFGSGSQVLLAFHGFGQSAQEFASYLSGLEEQYSVFVFDHYFHGESEWNLEDAVSVEVFQEKFEKLFESEGITRFGIVAYSLGGKWAFTCARLFASKIDFISLFAPDGYRTTFYYHFSTGNILGRKLFRWSVERPKFYFWILRNALRVGLITKMVYRFAYFQMDTETKRKQVVNTWIKYRKLKGLSSKTVKLLNDSNIPITLVLGKYDKVIQPKWFKGVENLLMHSELIVVPKGHRSILGSIAPLILKKAFQ